MHIMELIPQLFKNEENSIKIFELFKILISS